MERKATKPELIIYEAETVASLEALDPVTQGWRAGYKAGLKRMIPEFTALYKERDYFEDQYDKLKNKILNVARAISD